MRSARGEFDQVYFGGQLRREVHKDRMAIAAPGDRQQLACSKTWNGAWVSAANGVKIALLIGTDFRATSLPSGEIKYAGP
jgi:hypothetical protein